MARLEPTPEQLQAAFAATRLPHWPEDYDQAMVDTVRAALVRAAAVRQALGLPVRRPALIHPRPAVQRPEPPTPTSRPLHTLPPAAPLPLDRKRLAAGEQDD